MAYLDSNEAFLAELARRGIHEPTARPAVTPDELTRRDVEEMLPDFLALKTRRVTTRRAHPLAVQAHRDDWSLDDLQQRADIGMGAFGDLLAGGLSVLVENAYSAADELRPVVRDIQVRDFRPRSMGNMSFGSVTEVHEETELLKLGFVVTEAPRQGRLREFGGSVGFSRQVLSSYSDEIPAAFADHAALSLPAVERALLASALEGAACPTNAAGATVAGLSTMIGLLRNATNGAGQLLNLSPHAIICPVALETAFAVLLEAMGKRSMQLIVLPELTDDAKWWLCADPRRSAPLVRLRLRGSRTPQVYRHTTPEGNAKLALRLETDILFTNAPGLIGGGV